MKKFLMLLVIGIVALGMVGVSSAAYYYEEYTGYQEVGEGGSYYFGFDLWYAPNWVGTNSSLTVTTDASGVYGPYASGNVTAQFYSEDWFQYEEASIKIDAYGDGIGYISLGTYAFNGYWSLNPATSYYNVDIALSNDVLAALSSQGWGDVQILATLDGDWWNYNDFAITQVGLGVSVPEPASLILLGFALLGLCGIPRKR